ncbi:MAG: AAA family ATPase [Sedimentisphaerales bacterium]|nr:AAA family ATPase [Sedimentisphaerales bacterium]
MDEREILKDVNQIKILSLFHIYGQPQVVDALKVYLHAYFNIRANTGDMDMCFGPVLFAGPSGTGKTLVAKALHAELGNLKLIETSGTILNKRRELFTVLFNADENTSVFIDEAQGLNAHAQYVLLTAISEKAVFAHGRIFPLKDFALILATTHEYLLQNALLNRMRIICRFNYYSIEDLAGIVRQRADALHWQYESEEVLKIIAERAKRTPRLAINTNLQTCWHIATTHDRNVIKLEDVKEAFKLLQIDELGLDKLDRSYLKVLFERDASNLGVISSILGLPSMTIQKNVEPYLFREGFAVKDKHSLRKLTEKGKKHIIDTYDN